MSALALPTLPTFEPAPAEALTTSRWAELLVMAGVSTTESSARRMVQASATGSRLTVVNGGTTKVIEFSGLRPEWQTKLATLLRERHARTFAGLLDAVTPTWVPPFPVAEMGEFNTQKAMHVRSALDVYFGLLDQDQKEKVCALKAAHKYEELTGERPGFSTVRRWVQRVKTAGGHGRAPLQAYGEFKIGKEHHAARFETKARKKVPFGVSPDAYDLEAFKIHLAGLAVKEGMVIISGAWHALEIAWKGCVPIPGLGVRTQHAAPFPFTYHQIRRLTPGAAKRKLGGQGKWRATVDGALPTVHTSAAEMVLAAEYQFDDTRADFVALERFTGKTVTLKLYVCLEVATRRVVAWVVRRAGNFVAADTAALIARVLRHSGMAAQGAGYQTVIRVELGEVAMPRGRADLLEAMYPGQVKVVTTSAERGSILPGHFSAGGKGRFWQKPHVESFNRTFGFLTRWIPGQRGSDYRKQPAVLGTSGVKRKDGKTTGELAVTNPGSMLAEAALTATTARWASALEHAEAHGQLTCADAETSTGITGPVLYEDEALRAIELCIAHYNSRPGPASAVDFEDRHVSVGDGKFRRQKESPNEKYQRLFGLMESRGIAPVRMALEDVPVLLMVADRVTVTPQGVTWKRRRYWQPFAQAILRAQDHASHKFECLALGDPENPAEIFLLKNNPAQRREDGSLESRAVLWETLPLADDADRSDPASVARYAEKVKQNHDQQLGGLMRASESIQDAATARRKANLNKLSEIVASSLGVDLQTVQSKLGDAFRKVRMPRDPKVVPMHPVDDDLVTVSEATDGPDGEPIPTRKAVSTDAQAQLAQQLAKLIADAGIELPSNTETDW